MSAGLTPRSSQIAMLLGAMSAMAWRSEDLDSNIADKDSTALDTMERREARRTRPVSAPRFPDLDRKADGLLLRNLKPPEGFVEELRRKRRERRAANYAKQHG